MPVNELPSWTPTVQQVASHLIARTRMPNGELAKTFNQQTEPTDVDVVGIIQQEVRLLAPRLGDVPDALADSASALLALKAAIVVERSFFMEQIETEQSPYKGLCADFAMAMKAWEEAAEGDVPNGWKFGALPVGTEYPAYATGTY